MLNQEAAFQENIRRVVLNVLTYVKAFFFFVFFVFLAFSRNGSVMKMFILYEVCILLH